MSSSKRQKAEDGRRKAEDGGKRSAFCCLLLAAFCLLLSGCRQDMQDQPRYEAYESSSFFKDGLASRPLVKGTVPRGYLRADATLYTGKMEKAQAAGAASNGNAGATTTATNAEGARPGGEETSAGGAGMQQQTEGSANAQAGGGGAAGAQGSQPEQQGKAGEDDDARDFPFAVTLDVVNRGQERFEIYCSICHGRTGEGDGMIVRRGFKRPETYHSDRLRQAPVGYFFRVMTEGYGAMPSYRAQIPVQDRWAIAAYVRALQLSQMNQRTAPAQPAGGEPETGGHR